MPPPAQKFLTNWHPAIAADGVFSPAECSRIVAQGGETREAGIKDEGGATAHSGYRDSRVSWIRPGPETNWLFSRMLDFVRHANEAHFGIEIAGFTEPLQLAEYGPAQHYDWHLDIGNGPISVRKLSFIAQLTDPADYEGGAVEIFSAREPHAMPRAQGSVILFPSYILHRVAPVSRGMRRSLVGWIGGPHFR